METASSSLEDEILALQLQAAEAEAAADSLDPKGKRRKGDMPDARFAFATFQNDIEQATQSRQDLILARNIARDFENNSDTSSQAGDEPEQVLRTVELSSNSSTSSTDDDNADTTLQTDQGLNEDTAPPTRFGFVGSVFYGVSRGPGHPKNKSIPTTAGSSKSRQSVSSNSKETFVTLPTVSCICCSEQMPRDQVVNVPCGHGYCIGCLRDLFVGSTKDESLFPPRCCRAEIPPGQVTVYLTDVEFERFQVAEVEFRTANRTYCANAACAAFILPQHIQGDVGHCSRCKSDTCTICKHRGHIGDCPDDPDLQKTLALAAENGWSRCSECQHLVEITYGCNHIIIEKCPCPQFTERHLVRATEIRADRQGGLALDGVEREALLQRARREIQDRHDCRHERFEYICIDSDEDDIDCEECGFTMDNFVMQCRGCQMQLCKRCQLNRR